MHRRDRDRRPTRLDRDASLFHHTEARTQKRLRRGGPEAHDDIGLDQRELVLEPWEAGADLAGIWCLVQSTLGARVARPLEVLHRIRDIDIVAVDARGIERVIEQTASGADEGSALLVLLVARLFTHDHDARRPRPLAEHRLGPHLPQMAAATSRRRGAKLRKCRIGRNEVSG